MRLKRPSVHVARAIDRALSGEMVKTLRPAARSVPCGNQTLGARRHRRDVDACDLTYWLIPHAGGERRRRRRAAPRQARPQGQEARRVSPRLPAGFIEEPGAGRVPPAAGARARGGRGPEPPPREDAHGAQEDQVLRQRPGHQGRLDEKTARRPQALNPEPPTRSTKAKNKN